METKRNRESLSRRGVQVEAVSRRDVPVEASIRADGSGILSGNANVMGVIDSYRSIFVPGCFRDALPNFLARGHMIWNHSSGEWIGTPKIAEERGRFLYVEGEFYSDAESQSKRQKLVERDDRGKLTDFSITFRIDWDQVNEFRNGAAAYDHLVAVNGIPVSMLDPEMRNDPDPCWTIHRVLWLAEFGPVMVGAVPGAVATGVRGENDFESLGSLSGPTAFDQHFETVLSAVDKVIERYRDYAGMRSNQNKDVPKNRFGQAVALRAKLDELIRSTSPSDPEWIRLQMEADAIVSGF